MTEANLHVLGTNADVSVRRRSEAAAHVKVVTCTCACIMFGNKPFGRVSGQGEKRRTRNVHVTVALDV